MANIQNDIVDWLKSLKGWQTELAYKILTQDSITDCDISDILLMVKSNKAFIQKEFPNFFSLMDGECTIRLKSIESVSNIENLAPRNPLKFEAVKNLIVVYGSNGSGKSGYTKIIKKASGKPKASKLKANVFKDSSLPSKCTIKYLLDDIERSKEWGIDDDAISDLYQVDVFDTKTGEVYLKEANTVAYTPASIAFFETITQNYSLIGRKLEEEKAALYKDLPSLPENFNKTKPATIYKSINIGSTETSLTQILIWSDKDEEDKKVLEDR